MLEIYFLRDSKRWGAYMDKTNIMAEFISTGDHIAPKLITDQL